ncbi:MAG: ATP--guanido phosphotransferase [Ruminococcaceae bacterium]|jgi:protein arginine kinase|nr:ATP--guanido phosphotransferase [Oscillospiraceae bacterium]
MSRWYENEGKNSDVVLYSKVRLARNLADSPFPSRMSDEIRKNVTKKLYATLKNSSHANEFELVNLSDCTPSKAVSYAEKHLASPELVKKGGSLMLSNKEDVSVMLCEEDHIKINSFAAGQDLESAYEKANDIDDVFLSSLKIAYSDRLGFLTASPINLGTGLKASFILHLPALSQQRAIYKLSSMVGKLGLNLRELYKNGTGDLYVLSNQVSLGISEKSAIDNVTAICEQIVNQERSARKELAENFEFEDKVYRNLGVLKTARILKTDEFLNGLSLVRLGIALGYFDLPYSTVGDMLYTLQNATLAADTGKELSDETLDKLRAQIVREKL